jgi:putative ABC transport system permease protein
MLRIIIDNLSIALSSLLENRDRSLLTMLGIIIGVGSVILLVSIGQGVKDDITRQIDSLGTNVVFILPGKLDQNGEPGPMNSLGISTLTDKDVQSLSQDKGVLISSPISFVIGMVSRNNRSFGTFVVACNSGFFQIIKRPMDAGRVFTQEEEDQPVCVLADIPRSNIFGTGNAIDRKIDIRSQPFRVVGTLAKEEASIFNQSGFSNMIYIPIGAEKKYLDGGQINRIVVAIDPRRDPGQILNEIRGTLLQNHHGQDDFSVLTQRQLMNAIFKVFNIVTALLAGISAISLVVAGIGIMNIMLVTVTERTKEIGLRMTVGAKRLDIFLQFLTESAVLSLIGGGLGILLAAGICRIIGHYSLLHPVITLWSVLMAFGVCLLVGTLFGVGPAMRAARQDPISALRWE